MPGLTQTKSSINPLRHPSCHVYSPHGVQIWHRGDEAIWEEDFRLPVFFRVEAGSGPSRREWE